MLPLRKRKREGETGARKGREKRKGRERERGRDSEKL